MTLAELLLQRLGDWRPSGDGRHSWSEAYPTHGWSIGLAADRTDTVGCLVWELALIRTVDAPDGLTLSAWATGIADRASGLMEDLKLIELDDQRQEALLRSDEPMIRGENRFYYEIHLRGLSHATVRRYKANRAAGTRREQVAFALTHEVIAKLAGDIAG